MRPTRLSPLLAAAAIASGCGYQSIPQAENAVGAAWAEVENQYQRRADLVPNLVETVKGYAAHEKSTLEAVINARAQATQVKLSVDQLTPENMKKFEAAQGELRSALGRLLAVAENYPQLKANENFLALQEELTSTEGKIAYARQFYNDEVAKLNTKIQQFPTSAIAGMFGFTPRPFFEIEEPVRGPVQVDL
jgi:LemA protein